LACRDTIEILGGDLKKSLPRNVQSANRHTPFWAKC
jgi:hypothetical protein